MRRGISGKALAESISKSLAKRAVAMVVDGKLADLADPIERDASVKILSRTDPEALELIRHDAAHVMAEAVQSLWPGTQVTIGPVIENGFYYDFAKAEPFHPEDLAKIEAEDARDRRPQRSLHQGALEPPAGQGSLQEEGRAVQGRAGGCDPRGGGSENLQAGRMARPLPRPAHDLDRADRQGLQAHQVRRLLLARRSQERPAAARLRHRLGHGRGARGLSQADRGGREARPSQARARDGPLPLPGGGAGRRVLAPEGLGAVPEPDQLYPPAPECRRLPRGECAAGARQVDVGDLGPLGVVPREHVHVGHRGRARVRHQADELPGPHPDLQARAQILSRAALSRRRIRQRAPLRGFRARCTG